MNTKENIINLIENHPKASKIKSDWIDFLNSISEKDARIFWVLLKDKPDHLIFLCQNMQDKKALKENPKHSELQKLIEDEEKYLENI